MAADMSCGMSLNARERGEVRLLFSFFSFFFQRLEGPTDARMVREGNRVLCTLHDSISRKKLSYKRTQNMYITAIGILPVSTKNNISSRKNVSIRIVSLRIYRSAYCHNSLVSEYQSSFLPRMACQCLCDHFDISNPLQRKREQCYIASNSCFLRHFNTKESTSQM